MTEVIIPLRSHEEAILVLGPYDRYAKLLRQALDIEIFTRGGNLRVKGDDTDVAEAQRRIEHLLGKVRKGRRLDPRDTEAILVPAGADRNDAPAGAAQSNHGRAQSRVGNSSGGGLAALGDPNIASGVRARAIEPRGQNQRRYLEAMDKLDLVFATGVAGTGKTFLAVYAAVQALRSGLCRRLIITRPVVEAGERLGFLPGDLQAKLNPYMRPIYDAIGSILRFEDLAQLEEAGVVEVAPLAYMRGRTLERAFVILDEAQNTTVGQMKMFLTRLGEGSRMVVTGDPSQTDLDPGVVSGLVDAVRRLRGLQEVAVVQFETKDVVRHPLVERIINAYEAPPVKRGKPGPDPAP